jgi:UDP-2,4-diacetamido-2,4,6-trideoxy-beta-L-altropyranose hydrolase
MRCLTLANALRKQGHKSTFICRIFPGNLGALISRNGHDLHCLSAVDGFDEAHTGHLAHAAWLGVSQDQDFEACLAEIGSEKFDWIVVDHYGIDQIWEKRMRAVADHILVIDDLADRQHDCDMLLDQNFGRQYGDYEDLVPENCAKLLGPKYALLREEFAELRPAALKRRSASKQLQNILISMGGADKDNVTCRILDVLSSSNLRSSIKLTVVLGQSSPHVNQVKAQLKELEHPYDLLVGTNNMAELMVEADIAFGAAGSSSWERACLGLPTILITIAENQVPAAKALNDFGAAMWIGQYDSAELSDRIYNAINSLTKVATRNKFTEKNFGIADGDGCIRVTGLLGRSSKTSALHKLELRPALAEDVAFFWRCREGNDAWRYYKSMKPTSFQRHHLWYEEALSNDDLVLLIAEVDQREVGYVWFKKMLNELSISVAIAPSFRGRGLGKQLIAHAIEYVEGWCDLPIKAEVHAGNLGSLKAFKTNGFVEKATDNSFVTLIHSGRMS